MKEDVVQILLMNATPNGEGSYYVGIPDTGTLAMDDTVLRFRYPDGEIRPFGDLSEDFQYQLLCFLLDNAPMLGSYSQAHFVEIGSVDDLSWVVPPEPITALIDDKEQAIASLAVSREAVTDTEEMHSILLISPDGSWTTLSCFLGGKPDEVATAKEDVLKIAEAMKKFAEKL